MQNEKQVKTIVLVTGVYDILHRGHLNILKEAKKRGDYLIVAIQDDLAVFESKGRYPVLTTEERVEQMQSIPLVDEVTTYSSGTDGEIVMRVKPHIMVHGNDWMEQADRGKVLECLNTCKTKLILIPYTEGISDTDIKKRIIANYVKHLLQNIS